MLDTKDGFLERLDWETNKTIQVFSALPEGKLDYRPHENSRSALELIRTMIREEAMFKEIIEGKLDFEWNKGDVTEYGTTVAEIASRFKASHMEVIDKLKNIPEDEFKKDIPWTGGRQISRLHVMIELLFDQVHHRGQLSVYLRLTGGEVPSIYGPSFDEPMPD